MTLAFFKRNERTNERTNTSMSDGGHLRKGDAAALSSCRVNDATLQQSAVQQLLSNDEEILFGPVVVLARFQNDVNNEGRGIVVITSEQLLFWEDGTSGQNDLRVDAVCIDLHAVTRARDTDSDDDHDDSLPSAVYIQMSCNSGSSHDDDTEQQDSLFELSLQPAVSNAPSDASAHDEDDEIRRIGQDLFDAITKLIDLHPIDPNELDEPGGSEGGMWFGDGPVMTAENGSIDLSTDDNNDDELIVAPPRRHYGDLTDDDRNAMLERLDKMLIVPDELELQQENSCRGQFDDADSDDELL